MNRWHRGTKQVAIAVMGLASTGSPTAENLGVSTMSSLRIPEEIRRALALKTAERYSISTTEALLWIHDIEEKGTQSIFFEQIKPVAIDFFAPILSVVAPALKQIIAAAVVAGIAQARSVNEKEGN
jgi:hypothetical protein